MRDFETTEKIQVPEKLIDQIIGQDKAVEIIKKAAKQKRNALLIGPPGTGKSMLAQAMAELMPAEELEDVLVYPNPNNENQPLVKVVKTHPSLAEIDGNKEYKMLFHPKELLDMKKGAIPKSIPQIGMGRRIFRMSRAMGDQMAGGGSSIFMLMLLGILVLGIIFYLDLSENIKWLLLAGIFGIAFLYIISSATQGLSRRFMPMENANPKLIVDNNDKFTAPFIDATGAKAGALLGDCKHDPLQCFFPSSTIYLVKDGKVSTCAMNSVVDSLLEKYSDLIQKDEKYEGLILPESEVLYTLGFSGGVPRPVRISCVNRRIHIGKMSVVTDGANRLLVTPEHKIFHNGNFVEAETLKPGTLLQKHTEPVITKEDVIKTFSEQDQKDAINYYCFITIKNENPSFGYKRIAKILGIKPGQTRWWNNNTYKPKAVQTVERLEQLGLIPFSAGSKVAPIVARILGTTFGDGGIFSTLNGIFLSSAEEDSLNQYAQDLIAIFGEGIQENFERRISGVNNTGRVVWNTNRDVVRFFIALGAPVGRKNKNVLIPSWINLTSETQQEFFGAFLGNELCSPRFSHDQNKIQCFCFGLAGNRSLEQNRKEILSALAGYLNSYGIQTSPNINENEFRKGKFVWRLGISTEIENVVRFYQSIPIRYSNAKLERIRNAIENILERKKSKYAEFVQLGKTEKYALSTLRVSGSTLQKILLNETLVFDSSSAQFSGHVYNLTTESGNLFANGILASNSGGLGTPPHLRVESGAVHRANKGVLFIDEIASLKWHWQQELLTAMQEKKYPITGQSEMSSGALVKSEPAPSDFVLVAAGNLPDLQQIHPALRSRIRGAGYEVYVEDSMDDTPENEDRLVQFIAQEVKKDGRIPHFTKDAVAEIIEEARRMSGRKKKFTLNLRELGGLVRAAGDIARERSSQYVAQEHVGLAKKVFNSIEGQLGKKFVERKKDYETFMHEGSAVGRVNGLAVLGESLSGLVLPIVAEVTPASSKSEGKVFATGKLGTIAKEAVENVSAIVKKAMGTDISKSDIHIQFLQTYEGVEGDSASISIAVSVISAMTGIPVKQDYALTGSVDVRGDVLPVGGVTAKTEAAIETGLKHVLVPKMNAEDIILPPDKKGKAEIIPVANIMEVLRHVLVDCPEKAKLLESMKGGGAKTKPKRKR